MTAAASDGREVTSESSAVLHYTFTRFSDLKARRDRCDCAPTEEDAKRCFILPFDRMVRPHFCVSRASGLTLGRSTDSLLSVHTSLRLRCATLIRSHRLSGWLSLLQRSCFAVRPCKTHAHEATELRIPAAHVSLFTCLERSQAFMAASLKSDEELVAWFRQRLVWDDPAVVQDLLKRGLFSRIYTPQVTAAYVATGGWKHTTHVS